MPKISVVMCCYNSQQHIYEAITSVLQQTFGDFEFIIWDDGSTDGTRTIIESFDDERIRYFYHENTGLGKALRLACEKVNCPIIARMDADDYSHPQRFQIEYDYLQAYPDVILVSSAVTYIDNDNHVLGLSFPYTRNRCIKSILKTGRSAIVHPAVMFRKMQYDKAGGYFPLKKAQDVHLFSRMSEYGNFANLKHRLLNYRISLDSISTLTSGLPYSSLIRVYLQKMAKDEIVNMKDVELYNEIIEECKRTNEKQCTILNKNRYHISLEEKLYLFIRRILGNHIAEHLVFFIKDLVGFVFRK